MLTTYDRLLHEARITRTREATVDNRHPLILLRELQAANDVLRAEVQRLKRLVEAFHGRQ